MFNILSKLDRESNLLLKKSTESGLSWKMFHFLCFPLKQIWKMPIVMWEQHMKTRTFEEKKIFTATNIQAANIWTECYHLPILKPCKSKFCKWKTDHHKKILKYLSESVICVSIFPLEDKTAWKWQLLEWTRLSLSWFSFEKWKLWLDIWKRESVNY